MSRLIEMAREYLFARRRAYQRKFDLVDPDTHVVLADLAEFCHANKTTAHVDERAAAMLEGRRQVWLRLQHHLRLSEEELWTIYSRKDQNV